MTGAELKRIRKEVLKIQQIQLAALLEMPVRTLQDYENGVNPVPGHFGVLMGLLAERDERITQQIVDNLKRRIGLCTTDS